MDVGFLVEIISQQESNWTAIMAVKYLKCASVNAS